MSRVQSRQSNTNARPSTISDIVGLKVYTQTGVYIGTVDNVRVSFQQNQSTGVALTDVNEQIQQAVDDSSQSVIIPYSWVESVHDIVVTIDILSRLDFSENTR